MGETTFAEAAEGTGQPAARPLLPAAVQPLAVASVVICGLVIAIQGVWLRHGMETTWLDATIDTKIRSVLGGRRVLLDVLVWPGEPLPSAAMASALVIAALVGRRYRQAVLAAVAVPLAAALTELVLKPLIGWTPWGDPFPSGHVTSATALAATVTVLLIRAPAKVPPGARIAVACIAFLTAAAVAVGVIGADMHHFSDTIGGAAVGAGTVLLTALVLDLMLSRRGLRRR